MAWRRGGKVRSMPSDNQDTRDTTTRRYLSDLIAVHTHVHDAIARHQEDSALAKVPGALRCIENVVASLARSQRLLEDRAQVLGGQGALGNIKEALTTVSGLFAGLYGRVRPETASRALRDDYTALHFLFSCTAMLHATSRALGDKPTCTITAGIMRDLPPLILDVADLIPHAVLLELAKDHPDLDHSADDSAIREVKSAWHGAGTVAAHSN